jgi:hypothetical protein
MNSVRWNPLRDGVAAALILLASASFALESARGNRMSDPKTVETCNTPHRAEDGLCAPKYRPPGGTLIDDEYI